MPEFNSKTILIVEDDLRSQLALKSVLNSNGYRTFEAGSANEAVRHLYTNVRPDLIILDLRLPDKGGEQLNAQLRANSLFSNIPVIVTSAHLDEPLDRTKFVAVFEKPINTAKLLEEIAKILEAKVC